MNKKKTHPRPKRQVKRLVRQLLPMKKKMSLANCPVGLFLSDDELCLKTEYRHDDGRVEAYIVSSGESYWGGLNQGKNPNDDLVTPVKVA